MLTKLKLSSARRIREARIRITFTLVLGKVLRDYEAEKK